MREHRAVQWVAIFLGRALAGLVLAALAYGALRAPYQDAVARLAGPLLGLMEPGVGLAVLEGGAVVGGTTARVAVSVERTSLDLVLVGTVLLLALLAGTPRMWRKPRALGALAALFALQVVVLAVASQGSYWERSGQGSPGSAAFGLLGAYGGLILPLPLWLWAGGATWLFPPKVAAGSAFERMVQSRPAPRNGPCPCGCGRKAKHCSARPVEAR